MDRTTMIAKVRRNLGEDTADFWTDDDITKALEEGTRAFCHEEDWSWLSTYVNIPYLAAAATFELPADVDVTRTVTLRVNIPGTKSYKLKKVTPGDGFRLMSDYDTAGSPKWYFVYSTTSATNNLVTTIRLVPSASAAGSIDMLYYRRPAALSAGNSEPDIPEDYHGAIVARATFELWLHELDVSGVKANEQMSIYQEIVEKARMHEGKLGDDEQLAIGKMDDERERAGLLGPLMLPPNYGWPSDTWGDF